MATVAIISAHPDDETLGAGGTICKHVAAGDRVVWLVVSAGYEPRYGKDVLVRKRAEVDAVAAFYGMAAHAVAGLPCTKLDDLPFNEVIDPVANFLGQHKPELVYTVHAGDVHTDHRAVSRAVWTACKPFRTAQSGPRRILCWETLSSTEAAPPGELPFVPNAWVNIGALVERKLQAMALYASELHPDPLPRGPSAIRALARVRGAQVGVEYAEAFMVLRDYIG